MFFITYNELFFGNRQQFNAPFNVSRIFQRDAFAFIPFESLHIAFQKLIRNWLICHVRSKSSKRVDRANINIMQEVISMWIPKYRAEDAK